jgi:hypothetical protein
MHGIEDRRRVDLRKVKLDKVKLDKVKLDNSVRPCSQILEN